jgi:hypothetical protein
MIAARTGAGRTGALAVACALLALVACKGSTQVGPTTYVTVDPPATTVTSTTPETSPTPSPTTPSASPTPTVAAMTKLPGACAGLLPLGSIIDAIGRTVGDGTAYVVGVPDPTIDRVGYINCQYGVSKQAKTPAIEIGVSLYRTAAKAQARLQPTIEDYTQHAADASETEVEGQHATILTGGMGDDYGPTVVLAVGQRTIAVSLRPGAIAPADVSKDLTKLAALAARRTSGR